LEVYLSTPEYDIAVIGGGPGGYSAALRAAQLGLRVTIIEKNKVGGTCLHRGCIPANSILQCANMLESVRRCDKFGITVGEISFDWQAVQKAKDASTKRLFTGLNTLLKNRKVEVVQAAARLSAAGAVEIESESGTGSINAHNIIIATGSKPREIPDLPGNNGHILDTTDALNIDSVPESITIIGGGAYGVEFASMFRSFGAEVALIEKEQHLLPRDDRGVSKYLEKAFTKRGIKVYAGAKLEGARIVNEDVTIEVSRGADRETIVSKKLLVTVGRAANTETIDFDSLGIETRDGFITIGSGMRTSVENIYAVGDVTHNPQFANFAFAGGMHAAETIAGLDPPPLDFKQIPTYAFGYPEAAKVGYTEEKARSEGLDIEVVELPFQTLPRAAISRDEIGYMKMVSIKNGPVIGVHLVGPDVINLIPEAMLVTNWEATVEDLARLLHPHPVLAEAIGEAALKLAGKPLHVL